VASVIRPPLIDGGGPAFPTTLPKLYAPPPPREGLADGEFADVKCLCHAPPGDPHFVSLNLRFVQGRAWQMLLVLASSSSRVC